MAQWSHTHSSPYHLHGTGLYHTALKRGEEHTDLEGTVGEMSGIMRRDVVYPSCGRAATSALTAITDTTQLFFRLRKNFSTLRV
jgi:hypothetical protein